ncbi:unnamed protein product [Psylliodes chrysocephalus]|uniref:DUF659 domain-containing protein n=1 Tax=Psylliodes chrysocephalus TaxID=3402493 RepID=A0A9P0CF66_9CUCU|nr:unnamed protein product [Psylliodes chrysocephala]
MFTSDAVSYMLNSGRKIKAKCPQTLHVTCIVHGIHRIVEEVRNQFKDVDNFVDNVKKIFLKAASRVKIFKEMFLGVPLPPKSIITRWGTWIKAVCYFQYHYNEVRTVLESFDPRSSAAIRNFRELMDKPELITDIIFVANNFGMIPEIIHTLESSKVSVQVTLKKLNELKTKIDAVPGDVGIRSPEKMAAVLQRNPDLKIVKCLKEKFGTEYYWYSDIPVDAFQLAPLTPVDCERFFSAHKYILDVKRNNYL